MKKIIVAVVAVVVAALLVLPFLAGQKTQQTLDVWVAQMNQIGTYNVRWEEYNKGWLSSNGVLRIGFKMPADLASPSEWTVPLNLTVHHGPVLWRDDLKPGWFSGNFYLSEKHQAWIDQNLKVDGEGPFFVSHVVMDLAGNATIQDRSLPFQVTKDEETFALAGYTGEGSISNSGDVHYTGALSSIGVVSATGNLKLNDVAFDISSDFGSRVSQYVMPGAVELTVKSVEAATQAGEAFNLQNFRMSSDFSLDPDKTSGDIKFSMGFVEFELLGEKVEDAVLDFAFDNVGVSFLNKYTELMQQSYQTGGEPNPMLAMQMMGLVSSDLLPNGPTISIKQLAFKMPEGKLNFNGSIAVAADAAKDMTNPMAILSHMKVDAALTADKPLAFRLVRQSTLKELNEAQFEGEQQMTEDEKQALADNQTQMKLNMLTIQGVLIDKGEEYKTEFHFQDGKATLNGEPMPLPF